MDMVRSVHMNEIQSVGVVAFDGSKVLLVRNGTASKHETGKYGLPAGKVDIGETNKQAAAREFFEETGLTTSEDRLIPRDEPYRATIEQKDGTKLFVWFVFLCTGYEGELHGTDETVPEWVKVESLPTLNLLPNVLNAIQWAQSVR